MMMLLVTSGFGQGQSLSITNVPMQDENRVVRTTTRILNRKNGGQIDLVVRSSSSLGTPSLVTDSDPNAGNLSEAAKIEDNELSSSNSPSTNFLRMKRSAISELNKTSTNHEQFNLRPKHEQDNLDDDHRGLDVIHAIYSLVIFSCMWLMETAFNRYIC
jgi:hypothetical protein